MALTITAGTILASTAVAAAAVVTGAGVSVATVYEHKLNYKITNGASAPTTNPTIEVQASADNAEWFRLFLVGGDQVVSSVNSGSYPAGPHLYLRAIFTGGATNGSTMEVLDEQTTSY